MFESPKSSEDMLKKVPVWEGAGFYDWYRDQKTKKEAGVELPEFDKFLQAVETGEITLPFDLASFDIRIQREKGEIRE